MAKRKPPPIPSALHIMGDLETLGTSSNAAILSVALVAFDPWGKDVIDTFVSGVTLDSALRYGRVDASTLQWWFDPARDEPRKRWRALPQEDLDNVLFAAGEWVRLTAGPMPVLFWGNGATFDNVILTNAYAAVGLDRPWGYSGDRCFRTLKNLSTARAPKFVGVEHDPVDDAKNQVAWLQKIVKTEVLRVL